MSAARLAALGAVVKARKAANEESLRPRHGLDRVPDPIAAAIAAYEAHLAAAGWVRVPVEPTVEMMQDGHEAARKVRVSGISGMTIDAQARSECAREIAAYRAMLAARPGAEDAK